MFKKRLISIDCSSECLEKSLILADSMLNANYEFYKRFSIVNIYYGYNLPKKKEQNNVIGTVGFYVKNKIYFKEKIDNKFLIKNKNQILNLILYRQIINIKEYNILMKSNEIYLNFVFLLPSEIIFEKELKSIKEKIINKYNNIKIENLYTKQNLMKNLFYIKTNKLNNIYMYYTLNVYGNVNKYIVNLKKIDHMEKMILRGNIIANNTALLLLQIEDRLKNKKYVVYGYREHSKYIRKYRIQELNRIKKKYCTLKEPKNIEFVNLYGDFNDIENFDERNEKVYVLALKKIISKYGENND